MTTTEQRPEWLDSALAGVSKIEPERFRTPGQVGKYVDPRTVQTPALDLIDQALMDLTSIPDGRLIITMPPQEGKSTRVAGDFPVWWLLQHPDHRVVVASYSASLAVRNGKAIRRRITQTPELGLRIAPDSGAVGDWSLLGRDGGVFSIGIGGGLTGRPAELLVIDDPIKDQKEADSETFRNNVWDWWQTVASARLAPGAPVVIILTRWHQDDLAGRMLAFDEDHEWRVLNIPAQADHDPDKGETDVLARAPGEYMTSARARSDKQWERRKRTAGARAWAALYQGRPSPEAGGVLRSEWWSYYEQPMWIERDDHTRVIAPVGHLVTELIQSWDMTFKDTKGSDYVVGQVWLRHGPNAFLLDQVRGRWTFAETCVQVVALSARWPQAVAKLIEDKANGPAVMNALRSQISGMIPIEPEGSKYARASAVSPLVQSRNVHLPSPAIAPWVAEFVEEAKAFPNAAHDDQVDAFSQAIHRLLLVPMINGEMITSDDILAEEMESLTPLSAY